MPIILVFNLHYARMTSTLLFLKIYLAQKTQSPQGFYLVGIGGKFIWSGRLV
jgi:hypothetical protein